MSVLFRLGAAAFIYLAACGYPPLPPIGAPPDATCDPASAFSAPMPVMGLEATGLTPQAPRLSSDELTIYFAGNPAGQDAQLYAAVRTSRTAPFGMPVALPAENTGKTFDPDVSRDGLTLWFASLRIPNEGQHLYVATRPSTLAEFGPPGLVAMIGAPDVTVSDGQPFEAPDGTELWFTSTRQPTLGGSDIWRVVRTGAGFASPVMEAALSSSAEDWFPVLSLDRLTIYFASNRSTAGAKGGYDIWTSHRSSVNDGFPAPTSVAELDTADDEYSGWLSSDNCRLYGRRDHAGAIEIFVATRQP